MKVWLEKNENYIICYSARNGEESIEAKDGKPISVYYIDELQKQLVEKDKEIERLKQSNKILSSDKVFTEEQVKQIAHEEQLKVFKENITIIQQELRKQICDEIREKAEAFGTGVTGQLGYIVTLLLLDQIEKGE